MEATEDDTPSDEGSVPVHSEPLGRGDETDVVDEEEVSPADVQQIQSLSVGTVDLVMTTMSSDPVSSEAANTANVSLGKNLVEENADESQKYAAQEDRANEILQSDMPSDRSNRVLPDLVGLTDNDGQVPSAATQSSTPCEDQTRTMETSEPRLKEEDDATRMAEVTDQTQKNDMQEDQDTEPQATTDPDPASGDPLNTPDKEETKEEIEDPLLKKPAYSDKGGSAYDFGEIQNVPTQDTIPMVSTFSTEEEEDERHQNDSQALLAKNKQGKQLVDTTPGAATPVAASSREGHDDSTISSDSTQALNEKRKQERQCGICIFIIGFVGFVVAMVLLVVGLASNSRGETIPTMAPTREGAPVATTSTTTPTYTPTRRTAFAFPLPEITMQAIVTDPSSPQALAYQYMLADPNLSDYSDARAQQRFALATLFYATNGDGWVVKEPIGTTTTPTIASVNKQAQSNELSFLSYSVNECDWMPLLTRQETCNDQDQYLTLHLPRTNLQGALPAEVPLLLSPSTLETINLNDNILTGYINTEMALLTQLRRLDLSLNQLIGPVPTELGACSHLTGLALQWNTQLSQTLPTELGLLTSMQHLWIFGTMVSGVIPTELGLLRELKGLFLQENKLQRTIPTELLTNMKLEELRLESNQLTGPIPDDVGLLHETLALLDLSDNALTSTIPTTLGLLSFLEELKLDQNSIQGPLPIEISKLHWNLVHLTLRNNHLQSSLPTDLAALSKLKILDVSRNQLSGSLPTQMAQLTVLESLRVGHNQLENTVPSEFGLLQSLWNLDLETNNFTGEFPSDALQASSLRRLLLSNNPLLRGRIEDYAGSGTSATNDTLRFDSLPALVELTMENTSFTGTMPVAMCGLLVLEFTCSGSLCGCDCECVDGEVTPETPAPSEEVTNATNIATTVPSTTLLDAVPTATPSMSISVLVADVTQASNDTLTFVLPDYTLVALENPQSPQSMAWSWLQQDPSFDDYSSIRAQQRFALATLIYSSLSTPWNNSSGWLSYELHECDWYSDPTELEALSMNNPCERTVLVENTKNETTDDRQYIALLLPDNGLRGVLPPELAMLSELRNIDLSGNLLTGTITATFGGLEKLEVLDLGRNFLQGLVPTELGMLSNNLLNLLLWENQLQGPIPSHLGQLHDSLLALGLSRNLLTGTISTELGALTRLERLWLFQNKLSGSIPEELSRCRSLQTLDIASNKLTGRVPTTIGLLTTLEYLSLAQNLVGGSLVTEIGHLGRMVHLDIAGNLLQGAVPSEVWTNLTSAVNINLSRNSFSGRLAGIGSVDQPLRHLYASENLLTGEFVIVPASESPGTCLTQLFV
jgi:Leucine-rich repeat (LRR) protein